MWVRNVLFSVCLVALLLLPSVLFVSSKCGMQVSELLTTEKAKYLSGGVADVDLGANLAMDGFVSGASQSALTDEIDTILL